MIEDDDMREAFFDLDGFAEEVTVTPSTGQPFTLRIIFDALPVDESLRDNRLPFNNGARLAGNNPRFRCLSKDMPRSLAGRATVAIRDKTYNIRKSVPDGTGMMFVEITLADEA